jgi:hypothetical protein
VECMEGVEGVEEEEGVEGVEGVQWMKGEDSPLVPPRPSSHQLTSALVSCLINTAIRIYVYDLY